MARDAWMGRLGPVAGAAALLALATWGCDGGGGDDGDAGPGIADARVPDAEVQTDGTPGQDGGGGGGGGGDGGGMGPGEEPIDQRCPDAQAGTYVLVAFPDRVDAYRQRDFGGTYFCKFLDLAGNGITDATGLARSADVDGPFLVVRGVPGKGEVYTFDANGAFIERVESNLNLAGIAGIWPTYGGDGFVVWSRANNNLYRLSATGRFEGPYQPPQYQGSRVTGITDMLFVRQDAVVMTFSDRPAKLFAAPFAPDFPPEEVGPGNALAPVETPEGTKILMTAEVDGAGNGYGVVLYKAAESGRVPPERERVLVVPGEIKDGVGLLTLGSGLLVLDSALGGAARMSTYNHTGEHQMDIRMEGGGNPFKLLREPIFPDF